MKELANRIFMKRLIILSVLIFLGFNGLAKEFNDKQKAIIYNEAIKLLKSYEMYSNQMADEVVNIDDLNKTSQKLIDQFVSRKAIIYNDLDPMHKLSQVYELETYVSNILLWYPDGMKIYLDYDNLKAGNIISHGNDIYTVDIMTNKRIDGNYLNKQKNTNTEELLFRIAFFEKNGVFENYKIAGVRNSKLITVSDDSKLLAEVKSIAFSEKDMQLIKDQTKGLLNDYINFLNLLSDPKESTEDKGFYRISFLGLFKDSTLNVANDIEPDPQSRWINISDYQQKIITDYPEGIRNLGLNLDSAQYSKVVSEGNEKFFINGYIDKFFSGKYKSKTVYRDNSKFDFKVTFERDENTFKNFKLSSIDKFGVNLYNQTTNTTQELPQQPISSLKRNGLFIGLSIGSGLTSYNNSNLSNNSLLNWSQQGKLALDGDIHATWYFNKRIGLKFGVGYLRFSANTSLNGKFRNTQYSTDIDGNSYQLDITANYDSLQTLGYISIPISLVFHSNSNPEKWGFYAETGLIASFNISSTYKTTGSYATSGFYEQYDVALQINANPALGFKSRSNIDSKGKVETSPIYFALKTSIGITYPINCFTTVYFGPEMVWGLSNISKNNTYTDGFGNTSSAKKIGLSNYGIKFGISYKF